MESPMKRSFEFEDSFTENSVAGFFAEQSLVFRGFFGAEQIALVTVCRFARSDFEMENLVRREREENFR